MSRRSLLRASARAGVGATGLALVGCGDDDDGQQTVAQAQQQEQQVMQQQAEQQPQQQQAQQQQAEQQAEAVEQQEQATVADALAEEAECSVPWPLDQVDLDASIVTARADDGGGLDQQRNGSFTNYHSHAAVFNAAMEVDPRDANPIPSLATPEWIDRVTVRASVVPAPFHDGSILTAHDVVFSYDRMAGKAAYHQGGETTDHPGGWTSNATARGSANWVRNEAVDDRTWAFELPAPDAGFFTVNLMGVPAVAIMSQADVEGRGDLAVDQSPMDTGPYRFVSHTDDESFVYERFEDHFRPVDHPVRVPHYAHNKRLTALVRPEVQSQLAGIEAGEIDMLVSLGPDVVGPFVDDPDFTVQFVPAEEWSTLNIYPNLWAETMDDGSHEFWLACETALRLRQ